MSDSYVIDGVTVTPQAGGYYDLEHGSLAEAEKVRGKEKADERAKEIAAAAAPGDGSMPPQPPIGEVEVLPGVDLQALVEQQAKMIEQLLAMQTTTVTTDGDPVAAPDPLAVLPRQYTGQASPEAVALAAKAGVKYVTIILEEGNDIPPTGLFISHNFRPYMISPGEEVDVPDFLLGVLDDAIMSSPVVDSKSQKVLGYRSRMKYPYRRVS